MISIKNPILKLRINLNITKKQILRCKSFYLQKKKLQDETQQKFKNKETKRQTFNFKIYTNKKNFVQFFEFKKEHKINFLI